MAIRMRRGNKADFAPSRMLSGEFGVVVDNKEVYMTFAPGDVKQLMTVEDAEAIIDKAVDDATAEAKGYSDSAKASADEATAQVDLAKDEVIKAQEYANNSQASANNSQISASNSQTYANNSSNSATLSESWAVGNTGARTGENTNNSKYYSDMSKSYSQTTESNLRQAQALVDLATQSLASVTFDVDLDTGLLYQNTSEGTNINFTIDAEGVMSYEVEVA